MFSIKIVAQVKAGDGGEVGSFVHVGDSDEGHL